LAKLEQLKHLHGEAGDVGQLHVAAEISCLQHVISKYDLEHVYNYCLLPRHTFFHGQKQMSEEYSTYL